MTLPVEIPSVVLKFTFLEAWDFILLTMVAIDPRTVLRREKAISKHLLGGKGRNAKQRQGIVLQHRDRNGQIRFTSVECSPTKQSIITCLCLPGEPKKPGVGILGERHKLCLQT